LRNSDGKINSNIALRCSPEQITASGIRAVARCADFGSAPLPRSGRLPSGLTRRRLQNAVVRPLRIAPWSGDSAAWAIMLPATNS
jgi:hypothetical protein